MIPYHLALLAYIPLAALLMMDRDRARGFSVAFWLGVLFLPERYGVNLPGLPDIEKGNASMIGILIGTLLFHPKTINRFRFTFSDILLILFLQAILVNVIYNETELGEGFVRVITFSLNFGLMMVLARINIGTPRGIRTFMLTTIAAGCLYAPLALYEYRVSPQLHTMAYGYFQHDFQQFIRGGAFRPILFFPHALKLGQFFAFAAFLALLPCRNDLRRMFGVMGRYMFIAPLVALYVCQSWGPIMLFLILCVGYFVFARQPWLLYVFPIVMLVWLMTLFAGFQFGFNIIDWIGEYNPERAYSLAYRLNVLWQYKEVILDHPWFGHGGFGRGRIEDLATDSVILIMLLEFGWIGMALYLGWWFAGITATLRVMKWTAGTPLAKRAIGVATLGSFGIAISVVDNALDNHTIILMAGYIAVAGWLTENQRLTFERRARSAPQARLTSVARQRG